MRKRASYRQILAKLRILGEIILGTQLPACFIDAHDTCTHDGGLGMRRKQFNFRGESFRGRDIIGVHACDVGTSGELDTTVQRVNESMIGLIHYAKTPVSVAADDGVSIIGRTIVDNNKFKISECLPEYAVHRLA